MPAGFPKVDVNFILNAAGILKVEDKELRSGVHDLRRRLTRPVEATPEPGTGLREVLERLLERRSDLVLEWAEGVEVPVEAERLAQSVLAEALRNADRHAEPSRIDVRVSADGETFRLEVENDGTRDGRRTRGGGLGLRLAALEALHYEGLVEFGAHGPGRWRVRLVVPVHANPTEGEEGALIE